MPTTDTAPSASVLGALVRTSYFIYTDEQETPILRVVRKDYRDAEGKRRKVVYQQHPDAAGRWQLGAKDVRPVPYRCAACRAKAAVHGVVFVAEGELCIDCLVGLGLVATCNAGGAGKWTAEHAAHLSGAQVVVLPDNDDPGRAHGEQVARTCAEAGAASVRVLPLPGLAPKGDVVDWLADGHTRAELESLVRRTSLWTATPVPAAALPSGPLRARPSPTSDRLDALAGASWPTVNPDWEAQKARARTRPVTQVLAHYGVELHGKSRKRKLLCPAHNDRRHPSAAIDLDTGLWYCYTCGVGGDLFRFLELLRGWDFKTVVRELAS